MDKSTLINIATYLETSRKYKGHGSWLIYEDDKIIIKYDTYYPNVDVYVKIGGETKLVYLGSGHGNIQEYHPGAWEKYVDEVLTPRVREARQLKEANDSEQRIKEHLKLFAPIDDSAVFGS